MICQPLKSSRLILIKKRCSGLLWSFRPLPSALHPGCEDRYYGLVRTTMPVTTVSNPLSHVSLLRPPAALAYVQQILTPALDLKQSASFIRTSSLVTVFEIRASRTSWRCLRRVHGAERGPPDLRKGWMAWRPLASSGWTEIILRHSDQALN